MVRYLLIGTAGHVDHGKTSLIRALTGIDADRLPEEKERGMTIDVGFAYLDIPGAGRASIVDVPGHERFVHNMLVGALGFDVCLLCVAADEGVKPQTIEHFQIVELLPVDRMVVAMTRADLADEHRQRETQAEIAMLLEGSRFSDSPIIACSAVTGFGLDELREQLMIALKDPPAASEGPWYLPIDRVFSVKGHGCVVTGTMARGIVGVGATAELVPGGESVRIRAIHHHGEEAKSAAKGQRTAINLGGIRSEYVRRGMAIGAPGALHATDCIDATVRWVAPVRHGQRVRVSIGAEEAIGKAFLNDSNPDLVQLRLESTVAAAKGQPLILRRYSPPDLIGGGAVEVPIAVPRRRRQSVVVVSAASLPEAILATVGDDPNGVPTDEIARRLGKTVQELGDPIEALRKDRKLMGFAGLWFQPETFRTEAETFIRALREENEATPMVAFIPRDRVLKRTGRTWEGKPLDRIISLLAEIGKLEQNGPQIKHAQFRVQMNPKQRQLLDRVLAELTKEPVNVASHPDLARALVVPPQAITEVLRVGSQAGEVVAVGEYLHYTPQQIEGIKKRLRDAFGNRPFTAAEGKDALGTSRKYAIPLFEHLDKIRFTLRTGDTRAIR